MELTEDYASHVSSCRLPLAEDDQSLQFVFDQSEDFPYFETLLSNYQFRYRTLTVIWVYLIAGLKPSTHFIPAGNAKDIFKANITL